jgi:hypothetical protein
MPRKKLPDSSSLLIHPVRTRVTDEVYKRLLALMKGSDCRSMGELARRILSGEGITLFHKDAAFDEPAEKLMLIYRELKAIGVNLNQVTRHFHQANTEHQKAFQAYQIAQVYKQADVKIMMVLGLISKLSEQWLQK